MADLRHVYRVVTTKEPRRRHPQHRYFTRAGALYRLAVVRQLGGDGYIERARIGPWERTKGRTE
ncbi:hypothetical protein [Nocardia asiatica]|uniref:hypothetical protein n=1 Tax=Nocardia asiatica TaxID=209252 RepID=UPI0024550FA2|nr:hypothetical protein [Nocardia asiatica]